MSASKRRRRRSTPKAKQAATTPQPEVLAPPEPEAVWESEIPFGDVEDFEVGLADERQLRLLMKDWRKGRATRTVWDMITDGYVTLFSLVVIVAMVISGLMSVQQSAAGCSGAGCVAARGMLPWLTLSGVVLISLTAARIFGPVIASAAEGFWLLDAPIRRARLLSRRLWGIVIGALLIGTLLGALVTLVTGLDLAAVIVWALAIGLSAAAIFAFAAVEQSAERTFLLAVLQAIAGVIATLVLGVMVAVSSGWLQFEIVPTGTELAGWVVLAVAGVALVAVFAIALARVGLVRRARLLSGGDLLSGMQGAMFALDFGLMRDILVERRWLEKGHVNSVRGRGAGRATLIWREVEKLMRNPRRIIVLLVSALIPYALLALGLGNLTPAISAIILMFVMVPFFDSLRVLSRTRGLARSFPMSTSEINGALTLVPAVLALLWALIASPAFAIIGADTVGLADLGTALLHGFVTAAAGYVAAIRWVSARPADYSMPMVATGIGAMPPGLFMNLIRGFDVIALITLPLLIGWPAWIPVAIATICYMVLRSGGIDTQEMMERQAEAKRELDHMKQAGAAPREKIVVQRGQRPGTR